MLSFLRAFVLLLYLLSVAACVSAGHPDAIRIGHATGAGDARIVYEDRHTAGPGPVFVLVHGWNCDRSYWRAQLDSLAEGGRVVAIDLGGHGESGAGRADWSIEAFGQDVAAVVDHLNITNAVLVGHSMGGPVVLEAAARLDGRVLGVVGVDTFQDIDAPPPPDLETRLDEFRRDFAGSVAGLMPYFFTPAADPALRDRVEADMILAPPEISLPALEGLMRYDAGSAIARLRMPAATINGDKIPTDVAALRKAKPGFEVIILEDTGHFLMMERPAAFDRELRRIVDRWSSIAAD